MVLSAKRERGQQEKKERDKVRKKARQRVSLSEREKKKESKRARGGGERIRLYKPTVDKKGDK